MFVCWWQHRLFHEDLLDLDIQLVLARGPFPVVSIEICLRADVQQAMMDQPLLVKQGIERVDVRSYGSLQCRVW